MENIVIELRTIILNILLQGIWSEIGNIMLLCKISLGSFVIDIIVSVSQDCK